LKPGHRNDRDQFSQIYHFLVTEKSHTVLIVFPVHHFLGLLAMCIKKRSKGATTAIVALTAFVLVIIGLSMFFFIQFLAGGRKLQSAVDSGNLNVAKQAISSPQLRVIQTATFNGPYDITDTTTQAAIQSNFSALADTDTGNGQIDLRVYNRLVAQALLVSMNAAADGQDFNPPKTPSSTGITRAQNVIKLLTDPQNGIGPNLTKRLQSGSELDNNFNNLVQLASLSILQTGDSTNSNRPNSDVAFMLQPTATTSYATNVYISSAQVDNVIPPAFQNSFKNTLSLSKYGNYYLTGYSFLDVPGITDDVSVGIMGVPLRPRQAPHLVDGTDFEAAKTAPYLSASIPLVPPNAFKSGGEANAPRGLGQLNFISCSIAGAIDSTAEYPMSMPGGFIVVANGAGTDPVGFQGAVTVSSPAYYPGHGIGTTSVDIFTDLLMNSQIFVSSDMSVDPNSGKAPHAFSESQGCIEGIEEAANYTVQQRIQSGQPAYQSPYGYLSTTAINNGIENCLQATSVANKISDAMTLKPHAPGSTDEISCSNKSVSAPGPGNPDSLPPCFNLFGYIDSVVNNGINGTAGNGAPINISAIEYVKEALINQRASSPNAVIEPLNICTGTDAIDLNGFTFVAGSSTLPTAPTIQNLLGTGGVNGFGNYTPTQTQAQTVLSDVTRRLYQMKPNASAGEISTVLGTSIPLGSVMYIWLDTSQSTPTFKVTDASQLPARINPTKLEADGTTVSISFGGSAISPNLIQPDDNSLLRGNVAKPFVDSEGDGNYEHPYDCVDNTSGYTNSNAIWTPSSGADNLEGILRFDNCVNTNGQINFSCPC